MKKKTTQSTLKPKKRLLKPKLNRKKIVKKLDELASKLCCLEWGGLCALCGKAGSQTHHYFSRRHYSLRWNTNNLLWMCFACHIRKVHQGGEIEELREKLIETIGIEKFQQLKTRWYFWATNYKTAELEELRQALSNQLEGK